MARRKDESLINNRKQKKARKVMFAVGFLLTLLCIGTGSYVQELDTVQVGSVAEKRYVAEADAWMRLRPISSRMRRRTALPLFISRMPRWRREAMPR